MKLLQDKVAIVTGAARGIGEAIALKLAEHGAHIAFTYVSDSSADRAAALVTRLGDMGVRARAWQTNAGDYTASELFVADVLKEFGAIDVCVNNAGISKDNLLLRMTPEQWDEVMDVNLKSVFNLTKQVIRPMMKARRGSIINMSSIIGIRGNAGQSSYAASKAGLESLIKGQSRVLARRNIRANAVAPGDVDTAMGRSDPAMTQKLIARTPLGRMARPMEVAAACVYLASPLAAYITGTTLHVDGGFLAV